MPDGARILGWTGDEVRMQVSMPTEKQGFFGRQCPTDHRGLPAARRFVGLRRRYRATESQGQPRW
jgi:hypothetical protein